MEIDLDKLTYIVLEYILNFILLYKLINSSYFSINSLAKPKYLFCKANEQSLYLELTFFFDIIRLCIHVLGKLDVCSLFLIGFQTKGQ